MSSQPHDRGGDSYRPSYGRNGGPPPPPAEMYHFRGVADQRDRNDRDGRDGRSAFNFRPKFKISDRPLLRARRGSREEVVLTGADVDGEKFRNLNELTDSDEAEMEGSEDGVTETPPIKRARLDDGAQPDEKPKWSNPDPYTALPAPSETTGKKLDFVKLIRKARNTSTRASDLMANTEDFISFGDMDAADPDSEPLDAPTGPSAQNTDMAVGKRKRGDTTGAKIIARRGRRFYADGMVLEEWSVKENVHPTPWIRLHQDKSPGLALHKEILDFYEWVKPQDYEYEVRAGVIARISHALNRIEPGELKAFGSFAAGLYLPTGDMDLVYLPRGFNQRRGWKEGISHNQFRKYGNFIRDQKLARPGSLQLIPSAKVPIIKFVEKVSGLKVDLSFNNDTGVVANDTFQRWKEQYPEMPILTSLVKQFLMIRGLNDVSVGGLGGFSTICLVTHVLQHLPLSRSPQNLGQVLMEFFNVYGNLLDRETVAIRMDPPGYVNKATCMPNMGNRDRRGRLTIIDPNRPDNNISGGSSEIDRVFRCFARAHEVLQNRMVDFANHDSSSGRAFSFLEDLIGGNFEAYREQRNVLYRLHYGQDGPTPAIIPPPPPPILHDPLPAPPPPAPSSDANGMAQKQKNVQAARGNSSAHNPSDQDLADHRAPPQSTTGVHGTDPPSKSTAKKTTKAERRAIRLKNLRPDIASFIGTAISLDDAVKFGRYENYNEMDKDLTRREQEMGIR